ncbi:hypothetical protein [Rathayibacter soli]|uniref:hypothetical protein n=1 Tax=Rathayibacter soli TaxID=3144168 RepID=UPI0027E47B0C|nr:hypothetical protein [Glaciibacter superstes]
MFATAPDILTVGPPTFAENAAAQGAKATALDWAPPDGGDPDAIAALDALTAPETVVKIEAANAEVVDRLLTAKPMLVGYGRALDVVPGMTKTTILHAGPPITWERMSNPMRGAVTGAIVFEGLAQNLEEATEVATAGGVTFSPCHEHQTVGSMAGVTSPGTWCVRPPTKG